MIAKGTKLRLYNSDEVYTIGDFKIDLTEERNEQALLELIKEDGVSGKWQPVWMIMELRKSLDLYKDEEKEFFDKLRTTREQREQTRRGV